MNKKLHTPEENIEVKEKKDKINKEIIHNILIGIVIFIYLVILNIALDKIPIERLEMDFKILSCILICLSVFLFEISYKKDNTKIMYHAIEIAILAFLTLTITYYSKMFNYNSRIYVQITAYLFAGYYILKDIIIYTKYKKKYVSSLSDIAEIIKKDEPVKKEATKRINLQEIQEALEKSEKEKEKND